MSDIKIDEYEEDFNYPRFTEDMIKTHTILIPSMLPIHMALFESLLCQTGYKVEIIEISKKYPKKYGLNTDEFLFVCSK